MKVRATQLTERQKLQVLADRFYNNTANNWQPKVGDYYTTPRADLELYYIIAETPTQFLTVYCDTTKYGDGINPAKWPKGEFLTGFGVNRIEVKSHIFDL